MTEKEKNVGDAIRSSLTNILEKDKVDYIQFVKNAVKLLKGLLTLKKSRDNSVIFLTTEGNINQKVLIFKVNFTYYNRLF